MRPTFLCLALALLAPADPTTPKMVAALDSVSADTLRADVTFLSSDELGGRDTPSPGLEAAARFLRSRLERLGWKPGAQESYFYTYPLDQKALDPKKCAVAWDVDGKTVNWVLGTDYYLAGMSELREGELSGPVIYAGVGDEAEFDGARGRWVFALEGAERAQLARAAKKAKAKGLLVAPGPDYAGKPYAERFGGATQRLLLGRLSPPKPKDAKGKDKKRDGDDDADFQEPEEPAEPFTTLYLAPAAAERLAAAAKKPGAPARGEKLGEKLVDTRGLTVGAQVKVENVCGLWPGSDPELSKEIILLSAHYDHVGTIDGVVHNGADDNGSGSSLMLAVAEALSKYGPLARSVMILWVSGEEKGLWGSRAWSDDPYLPDGMRVIANINIDMVGRNAPDMLLVTPTKARAKDHNGLVRIAEKLAPLEGFPKLGSADQYYTRSDHYMFARLGIPVMFLFSDVHEDYHQPGDDAEKLDYDKVRRVARLVLRVLDALQEPKLNLEAKS